MSSKVEVFARGMLVYTWSAFLVLGGRVVSMMEVSGLEQAVLDLAVS
jgi:hypothetical protein